MTDPVVIQDLHKVYHPEDPELSVRAVDGISFSIPAADAVAIIGASGCGKSTLLNMLGCLDRPTSGTYLLEGEDVASLHEDELARLRNRHIGFVFQSFNLLPRMTAEENVALPLLYSGAANAAKLARDALGRVGLADRATHVPNELSGGQKQRVAIARAIVTRPSILLCDEPTGALDSQTGDDVLRLIQDLNRDGTTLIMVTHDLQVARRLDRALHMVDGRIEQDGKASEVVDRFVAELASAAGAEA